MAKGSVRRGSNFVTGFRRKYYGPITHVKTSEKAAALTFDDGPHPEYTPALLRTLKQHGAKATFFMVGETARMYPDVVRAVAEEGHAIANHSFSHAAFPTLSRSARANEIEKCASALEPYSARLFRPPYGLETMVTHRDASRLGYRVIKWNVSVDDWRDRAPNSIAEQILHRLKPGSIALLHDNRIDDPNGNQMQTVEAVDKILFVARGFRFCTVPELLSLGTPMTSFSPIW